MIDAPAVVHEFLTRPGTPLFASVADRVWTPVAPRSWVNETNAIVYHQASGSSHTTGSTIKGIFLFKCFGGSGNFGAEHGVFQLLYEHLQGHAGTTMSGKIMSASLVSDFQMPPEPDTNYKSHTATFSIQFEGSE